MKAIYRHHRHYRGRTTGIDVYTLDVNILHQQTNDTTVVELINPPKEIGFAAGHKIAIRNKDLIS